MVLLLHAETANTIGNENKLETVCRFLVTAVKNDLQRMNTK